MAVNPEAVAWYLQRSELALSRQLEHIESLRARAAQLAAFSAAVLTLAGADAKTILSTLNGAARGWAGTCLLVGSALLIAASVVAVRGASVPQPEPESSTDEAVNYSTDRFVEESEIWRVQLRTVRGLRVSIESTSRLVDRVAQAIRTAQRYFFGGLSLIGIALGTLVVGLVL
jgi:hypothetical protein